MKPQQLRIGNYVFDGLNNVHRVECIKSSTFVSYDENGEAPVLLSKVTGHKGIYICDKIIPIPLTEEWLLNFGFEAETFRLDKRVFYQKNKFMYNTGSKTLCYDGSNMTHIKYVHQIQNLYFALTGQELEYNAL